MRQRWRRPRRLGVGGDTAVSTVVQIAAALTNLVLRVLIYRSLASEAEAGVFALMLTYLSLASAVADFGLAATLQPRMAAETNVASAVLKVGLVARVITSLAGWVVVNVVLVIGGKFDLLPYVNIAFLAVFVSARLIGVRQFLDMAWRMKGRGYVATLAMFFDAVLVLCGALLLMATDSLTVWSLAVLWGLGGIPGFLMLVLPLRPVLAEAFRSYRLRPVYLRRVAWAALPVAVMYLVGQFTGQLETLVIDAFGSIEDVGRFNAAISPLHGILFLPGAIAAGVAPLVARLWRRPQADLTAEEVVGALVRIVAVIALFVAVVTVIAADEILRLLPNSTAQSVAILRSYAGVTAMVFVVVILDVILLAIGRRRTVLVGSLISLAIALALEIAMIGTWGVVGILAAKAVSVVALIVFQLIALHRSEVAGVFSAVMRVIPGAVLFLVTWLLARDAGTALGVALPMVATMVGIWAARAVTRRDVQMLRSARLW